MYKKIKLGEGLFLGHKETGVRDPNTIGVSIVTRSGKSSFKEDFSHLNGLKVRLIAVIID